MSDKDLAAQLADAKIYAAELERALDAFRRRALELEASHGDSLTAPPPDPDSVSPRVEANAAARDAETVRLVFEELRILQNQYLEADAVIGDLVRANEERLADINAKAAEIDTLAASIESLRAQLADRDGLIVSLTETAEARLEAGDKLREQLVAKEEERKRLVGELAARQAVIDELVAARSTEQRVLEERDDLIQALQRTCDERLELARKANEDAADAQAALGPLQRQLEEKELEIRRLETELANRQELLERLALAEGR